jgi:hypothetical protein
MLIREIASAVCEKFSEALDRTITHLSTKEKPHLNLDMKTPDQVRKQISLDAKASRDIL